MDKFIKPDPRVNILARTIVADLRETIRNMHRLHIIHNSTRIDPDKDVPIKLMIWLRILSFMTIKICALYLGQTDYEFNTQDIDYKFIRNGKDNYDKTE